jgi:hypothetical protein
VKAPPDPFRRRAFPVPIPRALSGSAENARAGGRNFRYDGNDRRDPARGAKNGMSAAIFAGPAAALSLQGLSSGSAAWLRKLSKVRPIEENAMTVSSITSGLANYLTGAQNPYQAVKTTYGQLQQNLTAGNLPGAQQVYTALAKAIQNSPIGQTRGEGYAAVQQSLGTVAQALQSGDLGNIQTALASLGNSINTAAQSVGAASQAPAPMTPSQLTASLVNEIVSGNAGGAGTDPLLAAMNGSGGSGSSDPLIAALDGDSDTASAPPPSGVNIVV